MSRNPNSSREKAKNFKNSNKFFFVNYVYFLQIIIYFSLADAKLTSEKPLRLVSKLKRKLERDDRVLLPSNKALKQRVRRSRRKTGRIYNFGDINYDLPEELTTVDSETAVIADLQRATGRATIFSTKSLLKVLARSKVFMVDGTFGVVPNYLRQLLVIHAGVNVDNEVHFLPVIYVLATHKNKRFYIRIFEVIKQKMLALGLSWTPETSFTDMELGLILAIRQTFYNISTHTCFFHLAQAVLR